MAQAGRVNSPPAPATVVTPAVLRDWPLPVPGPGGTKESRGSVLVVGGAVATVGAVLLAGVAALRAGAGKLAVATAGPVATALAVALPEASVQGLPVTPGGTLSRAAAAPVLAAAEGAAAILVGPGLADPDETLALVGAVLEGLSTDTVVVLDALGCSCGAATRGALARFAGRVILTPNPAEMAYLLDDVDADAPVGETCLRAAEQTGAVIAYRGAVAAPGGDLWFDQTGHAGLGTSGSGDVLAGVATGLAARGATAEQAAVYGVSVHGAAGDRLAARVGRLGFLARELLDEVPRVLTELQA